MSVKFYLQGENKNRESTGRPDRCDKNRWRRVEKSGRSNQKGKFSCMSVSQSLLVCLGKRTSFSFVRRYKFVFFFGGGGAGRNMGAKRARGFCYQISNVSLQEYQSKFEAAKEAYKKAYAEYIANKPPSEDEDR